MAQAGRRGRHARSRKGRNRSQARSCRLDFGLPLADPVTCPASLDFPGRTTLLLTEIADRLGCSLRHLLNEVESGALTVLDLRAPGSPRRCPRVPIECYRDYICRRLSGPVAGRLQLLETLPAATRRQLITLLQASLS